MINHFTFNGHSTAEYGLLVTALNPYNAPSRRVEKIEIPYRNGDLVIDSGTYNNIIVSYEIALTNSTQTNADAIRNWLLDSQGYHQLSDTINTDSFRIACYYDSIQYTLTALYKYGKAVISFDCFPQRYLTSNTTITRSATSTTETDISGTTFSSHVYPLPIDLKGNTSQITYSGKNLLNIQGIVKGRLDNGVLGYASDTSVLTLNANNFSFTTTANYRGATSDYIGVSTGNYIFNSSVSNSSYYLTIACYDSNKTFINNATVTALAGETKRTLTIASGTAFVRLYFYLSTAGSITFNNPQFETGSTVNTYEPYVGGISSPNPSYPQTIHNVSGDNSVIVCGKNMFRDFYTGSGTYRGVTKTGGDKCVILNGTYNQSGNYDLFFSRSTDSSGTANMTLLKANTTYAVSVYLLNGYTLSNISYFRVSSRTLDGATFNWNYKTLDYANGVAQGTFTVGNTDLYLGGIRMALTSSVSASFNNCIVKIQVEEANAVTPFEEYKGITYPINLPVENLLNNTATSQTKNNIVFTVNDDKTVLANGKANSTSNLSLGTVTLSANTTYFISGCPSGGGSGKYRLDLIDSNNTVVASDSGSGVSYTPSTSGTYTLIIGYWYNFQLDNLLFKPQLERGTKANTYQLYGTTPIELRKIGTYQDYLYKSGSKWYLHREIGLKYCDGTENWTTFSYGTNSWRLQNFISTTYDANKVQIMSTQFKGVANADKNDVDCMIYTDSNALFTVRNTTYTSQRAIQSGMSGQPIYYALRTATNTEITDATLLSQLNAIDNAMAFETSTTIAQVNNDLPINLTVTEIGSATVSSNYRGEPIITANSTGMIYFNGSIIKVNQSPMTINSQTMQAYNGNINLNNYIEINEFPMIEKGNNEIGSTMALSIVPNYWKL